VEIFEFIAPTTDKRKLGRREKIVNYSAQYISDINFYIVNCAQYINSGINVGTLRSADIIFR